MSRLQSSFLTKHPTPKIAHIGDPKSQKDPKIKSKSKVRVKGIIENECFSTNISKPQNNFLNLNPNPKLAH